MNLRTKPRNPPNAWNIAARVPLWKVVAFSVSFIVKEVVKRA